MLQGSYRKMLDCSAHSNYTGEPQERRKTEYYEIAKPFGQHKKVYTNF